MKAKGEFLPLIKLSIPLIVVNVGHQMMGVVDTALAGRIDEVSLGAAGLGNSVFFVFALMGIGLVMGSDPVASQAFGAGQPQVARRAMWQGAYAGLLITVPVAGLIVALGFSLELFGVGAELAETTRLYVHARLPSLIPLYLVTACRTYLQAAHLTRPIVISTLLANAFNFGADWVLIFGWKDMGIPAMGVEGIGWATSMAVTVHLLIIGFWVRDGGREKPDPTMLRQVFRLGMPIALQLLAEIGIFSLVALLAGTLGTTEMAAHQTALMLAAFMFMVPMSIGNATSVQVGRAIGRKDIRGTRLAGYYGFVVGGGFMLISAALMWIFPESLARIMTDSDNVIPLAADLILIAGAFQIFDGVQAVGSGALRGAGMTRFAMVANIISYWGVGVPVAVLLAFPLGMGPHGLWWGLTVGLGVAAILLTARFWVASRKPIAALDAV